VVVVVVVVVVPDVGLVVVVVAGGVVVVVVVARVPFERCKITVAPRGTASGFTVRSYSTRATWLTGMTFE
jgi:hypothetical protein